MSKKRVAIICGGRSSEHSISCISAKGVLEAIDRNLFEPILIGITLRGKWVALKSADDFGAGSDGLPIVPDTAPGINADIHGLKNADGAPLAIDLAFPLLHGAYGEDGTIQGLFEMADIPYVGSGVLASSVAMDKTFAKPIYADFGLAVADGITVHQRDWIAHRELEIAKIRALGLPVFVKPARSGSSRGTTKVKSDSEIAPAIEEAHRHDPRAMVEVAIKGREIECAVLEINGKAHASVLGEIRVHEPHEFYDFEAKYLDGSTTFDVPANVTPEIARAISDSAVTAFEALGCEGLARVDFFLTEDNQVIINELNTMPGFTSMSVFPMLWKATGKSYSEIITQLCESALTRPKNVIR
ncbi:MAG TPA: D-alanine--D-alanine ligase family protein [Candidatus Nanopelagicaceae bacterium]|nr:D-alanine--D-alanine ligase family protein [Candidatus Nanopelagicaceae bacterium]